MAARRIEDYALIGDLETAALVGLDGSIDWLCWPRFDSDACFTALLGDPRHGRWQIVPADEHAKASRCYREDTLILETRFETRTGAVTIIDFMPPRDEVSDLIRVVRCDRGEMRLRMDFIVRFGYGITVPAAMVSGPGVTPLYLATVEAVEEAIVNCLIAAETMVGRDGITAHALPHDRLLEVMDRYGRGPSRNPEAGSRV